MRVISVPQAFNEDELYVDLRPIFGASLFLKCEGFNFAGSIKLKAATEMVEGPVSVELAGVVQSVCMRQTLSEFEPKLTKYSVAPAGGAIVPSMSAGSTPPKLELNWKHCSVAAAPVSIFARS